MYTSSTGLTCLVEEWNTWKLRSLLPCIDLCEWFEDLQASWRTSCPVIRDGSALPSTFCLSGQMCALLTELKMSQSWRLSWSHRGCYGTCPHLKVSPTQSDCSLWAWKSSIIIILFLGGKGVFLHCIVIEVILQKKMYWSLNKWLIKVSLPVLNRVINEAGGEDENMNGCLEHVNTILAIYSFFFCFSVSFCEFLWLRR